MTNNHFKMSTPQINVKRIVNQVSSVWREIPELFQLYETQHDKYLSKLPPEPEKELVLEASKVDEAALLARKEIKSKIAEIEECLSNVNIPSHSFIGELCLT